MSRDNPNHPKILKQRSCCEPFCNNIIRRGVRCRHCAQAGCGAPPYGRSQIVDVVSNETLLKKEIR